MSAAACPFCGISAREAPAAIVADDGLVLAFMDLRQAVPGHVLVAPHRHAADLYALTSDEAAASMRMAQQVARALRAEFDPPGLNLWQSSGRAAGQEVFHFHLHVQPRCAGDGLLRVYPGGVPTPAKAGELEAMAQALRMRLRG
ncbi:HIT family protein [Rhodanobacter aciditrophus]|uniref:HIT family protein n=1 Tax=Rhodanobacter aciditrophus TaxID=1623218 RepID=UPI003CF17F28